MTMSDNSESGFYENVIVLSLDDLGGIDGQAAPKQAKRSATTSTRSSETQHVDTAPGSGPTSQQNDLDSQGGEIVAFSAIYCDSAVTEKRFHSLMTTAQEAGAKVFLWRAPEGSVTKPELLDLLEEFGAIVMVMPSEFSDL